MIKSELVQMLASENPHLFQRDIENIVKEQDAALGEKSCQPFGLRPNRAVRRCCPRPGITKVFVLRPIWRDLCAQRRTRAS